MIGLMSLLLGKGSVLLDSLLYVYMYQSFSLQILFLFFLLLCVHIMMFDYRQKLRRLEATLIEYRESLEERGIKNPEEIERKVAIHRKRLESEYGLSDSNEDASGSSK